MQDFCKKYKPEQEEYFTVTLSDKDGKKSIYVDGQKYVEEKHPEQDLMEMWNELGTPQCDTVDYQIIMLLKAIILKINGGE
jgi:hypothetical protein